MSAPVDGLVIAARLRHTGVGVEVGLGGVDGPGPLGVAGAGGLVMFAWTRLKTPEITAATSTKIPGITSFFILPSPVRWSRGCSLPPAPPRVLVEVVVVVGHRTGAVPLDACVVHADVPLRDWPLMTVAE
jgi:hypothetical protein